jgi:hypothetical protein
LEDFAVAAGRKTKNAGQRKIGSCKKHEAEKVKGR